MKQNKGIIDGFSKLSKTEKTNWVASEWLQQDPAFEAEMRAFDHPDASLQQVFDGFSENTIANFTMPYGIAPNFLINNQVYAVPMVIEESSVVAAASSAAKFWLSRGGFTAQILGTTKLGQLHFMWVGNPEKLKQAFPAIREKMIENASPLTHSMEQRGGGIRSVELLDFTHEEPNYYQLQLSVDTRDSMGANFINTVLESFGQSLRAIVAEWPDFDDTEREITVIMAILSNYTPGCVVQAHVQCAVEQLTDACQGMGGEEFAERFALAVRIAEKDTYRAVTHNKGIFNGIDAVLLATANDFRAVEACGHAYAARSGMYRSLSSCQVENGQFRFTLEIPLAIGSVGGLTKLHPLARRSLQLLGNPGAEELMGIIAATGLAQNFAAVRSLVTTGIQKGHMKMHLTNILNHLQASPDDMLAARTFFADQVVSFNAVRSFLENRKTLVTQ